MAATPDVRGGIKTGNSKTEPTAYHLGNRGTSSLRGYPPQSGGEHGRLRKNRKIIGPPHPAPRGKLSPKYGGIRRGGWPPPNAARKIRLFLHSVAPIQVGGAEKEHVGATKQSDIWKRAPRFPKLEEFISRTSCVHPDAWILSPYFPSFF